MVWRNLKLIEPTVRSGPFASNVELTQLAKKAPSPK
jgi:hypothetical protein